MGQPIEEVDFFIEKDYPLVFAHRGYSIRYPENTIIAFEKALEAGADVLEMDLWYTADDKVVVLHDSTIDRTTDGTGGVKEKTLDELQEYDAGYTFTLDDGETYPFRGEGIRIPSLEEVIEEFPDAYLNLEMKARDEKMGRLLAEVIEEHGIEDRVLVASFHNRPLREFRERVPEAQTSASRSQVRNFYIFSHLRLGYLLAYPYQAFQIPLRHGNIRLDTESFIKKVQTAGVRVIYWTINEREKMIELFKKNACGIVTDDVSTAVEVVREIKEGSIEIPGSSH